MRCEYTVSYDDFVESVRAYRRVSKAAHRSYWLCIWILPVAGSFWSIFCLSQLFRHDVDTLSSSLAAGLGLGVAFGFPARYRVGLKRAYRQRDTLTQGRPMLCEFDVEQIRFLVPGGTEISYPWTAFTDYFENQVVSVLFVKDAAFHTIPRRAMDGDGWKIFYTSMNRFKDKTSC